MTEFVCRVGTPQGRIVERMLTGASAAAARERLVADGFEVFDLTPRVGVFSLGDRGGRLRWPPVPSWLNRWLRLLTAPIGGRQSSEAQSGLFGVAFGRRRRISITVLSLLNQELASLVSAGLPLLRCLDILRSRRSGTPTGSMLDRVRERVAHGDSLSGAFRAEVEPMGLPELFVTSLEIGEASGDLESALRRYAVHLGRFQRLKSDVRSALMYPVALLLVAMVVVVILVTVVIPRFATFYSNYDAQLPLLTRMLVALADAVGRYGAVVGAVTVGGVFGAIAWLRTDRGARWRDAAVLMLPILGRLRRRFLDLETARTLGTLLVGGATVVRALEVVASGTANSTYRQRLLAVCRSVSEGSSLHEAFEETRLLEPMGLEMVQVGESTGTLEHMLEHVANTYDEILERQLAAAVGVLEPAVLVSLGLLVAAILLSLYLPLFQIVQVVG